jgi:PEP-CTERM motif
MKSFHQLRLLAAICVTAISGMANAQGFSNSHSSTIYYFGQPDTTSYGQVFNTSGGTLANWSFYADSGNAGNLELVIANWNGAKATGPALYQSSIFAYTGGAQALSFSGINSALSAGSYIAYLTVAGVTGAANSVGIAGSNTNGGMSGGFRFLNSAGTDPLVLSNSWNSWNVPNMQYSANFVSAVPEPETYAMMLAGLGLIGTIARRRKAKQTM